MQQIKSSAAGYSTGAQALVTWNEGPVGGPFQVKGIRVSSPLATIPSTIIFGGDAVSRAPVHSDEVSRYFTVWADQRDKVDSFTRQYDVFGSRADWNGNLLDAVGGFLITKAINSEILPAVGFCGSNYLVVWSDSRNGYFNRDLFASLLSSTGTIVTSPIAIATSTRTQDTPAVACNGTNFYVVWVDERNGNRDIFGSMIDATNGQVLNPGGVAIATTTATDDHPAIAYGGGNFKVVWDNGHAIIQFATVSGVTGALLSGPTNMTPRGPNEFPDIAFNGTNFWVVWQTNPSGTNLDISGASLTPSGTVGTIITIEGQAAAQRYPKLSWDAGKSLYTVVYEDDRNFAGNATDVYARRFSATGVVNAAFAVSARSDNELTPRIVTRASQLQEVTYSRTTDVFAQSINNGVLSGAEYPISQVSTIRESTPTIACSTSTSCMIPYRWLDTQSINNPIDRIKARLVSYP
jgi:hypothetical protein